MPLCHPGLDHLLVLGGGADGGEDKATELDVACFMGVISFFASRQEVLRISPTHSKRLLDATARAIIQTATSTDTPLTAAGLDGTGEIIQVRAHANRRDDRILPYQRTALEDERIKKTRDSV